MPTAQRRRAETARKNAAPTPAPAPPVEEAEAAPPAPEAEPELEEGPGPLEWRDMRAAPPFDFRAGEKAPHGPFGLRLNGRSPGTARGEEVAASWAFGPTSSGGQAWGWRTSDGRSVGWAGVDAWRPAPPAA